MTVTVTVSNIGVLIIDDDPNNVSILEIYLEDNNYNILTACDGVDGWEKLQQHKDEINVILLDRMMPNMDGMQFMEKLKADDTVADVPVIMQTAAAESDQIADGIEAGVYYYLTKPYEEEVMLSIVEAAINDCNKHNKLVYELHEHKSRLHIIKECSFEIKTLGDASYLSTFLANFYPDSEGVVIGLSELLINAVEHGNLGITYQEKSDFLKSASWEQEVAARQALDGNKDKKAIINFKRNSEHIELTIKDEGKGFDWRDYMEIDPDRATHSHGRGIALSNMMSFDKVEYKGCGSEVICTTFLNE